ncbi:unnamed protein product [Miscanthus lutarioriparius]|uniref:Mono-/di-acylglycerol lipase N-terminal domain-containing protein n=1 Tax=Miscanthus lutarioriparius TaxID=422564 RepID=A0A811MBB1_9POAL|nr:unnamed protein product [Miscanthus lutarioriparius]
MSSERVFERPMIGASKRAGGVPERERRPNPSLPTRSAQQLTYIGAYDSETSPPASPDEFEPVPRLCHAVLANYDEDLSNPKFAPPERGYFDIDPRGIIKRATYEDIGNACPPYLIYVDEAHKEIILAIRGGPPRRCRRRAP